MPGGGKRSRQPDADQLDEQKKQLAKHAQQMRANQHLFEDDDEEDSEDYEDVEYLNNQRPSKGRPRKDEDNYYDGRRQKKRDG